MMRPHRTPPPRDPPADCARTARAGWGTAREFDHAHDQPQDRAEKRQIWVLHCCSSRSKKSSSARNSGVWRCAGLKMAGWGLDGPVAVPVRGFRQHAPLSPRTQPPPRFLVLDQKFRNLVVLVVLPGRLAFPFFLSFSKFWAAATTSAKEGKKGKEGKHHQNEASNRDKQKCTERDQQNRRGWKKIHWPLGCLGERRKEKERKKEGRKERRKEGRKERTKDST